MNQLKDQYEMSQAEVAEKMFLCKNTVMNVEKRALEKFRKLLEERGISAKDILVDK
jgi:DNA-directed RNA polymerase specialized sigma24 family protein